MPTLCNIYTPEGNCVYARIYIVIKKIHFLVIQKKFIFMQKHSQSVLTIFSGQISKYWIFWIAKKILLHNKTNWQISNILDSECYLNRWLENISTHKSNVIILVNQTYVTHYKSMPVHFTKKYFQVAEKSSKC